MLNRDQVFIDINQMSHRDRYNHAMSAMCILFSKPDDAEVKMDALVIAKAHVELHKALTVQRTKL